MNTVALRDNFAVQHSNNFMPSLQELHQLTQLCNTLSTAPFYQKLGPGGVLAIWLTARELKLPPMMCLNGGLHNIEGKVSMSAQLMNMMIINAGHKIDVIYLTDQGCAIRFTRIYRNGNQKSDEYEFKMEDAKRAKYFGEPGPNGTMLSKPKANWTMYPRDMFFARALSGGAKKYLPEVMMNCYVFGEIEDAETDQIQSSHQFISNIVPLEAKNETQAKQCEPEQPQPELSESEIIQFKEKFAIGTQSDHDEYLSVLSEKFNKTADDMIICAAMNEKGFVDAFEKWKKNLRKKEAESVPGHLETSTNS